MITSKVLRAIGTAQQGHGDQMYGDQSYIDGHILPCLNLGLKYGADENTLCAIVLHDILEDTAIDEHQLRWKYGDAVADAVVACTDGEGNTRDIRKAAVYEKLQHNRMGRFVKIIDRMANIMAGGKIDMYAKEIPEFINRLYKKDDNIDSIWRALRDTIFEYLPEMDDRVVIWIALKNAFSKT